MYVGEIVQQIPRILSLMDREAFSPTAGCCDRTYWAWKFVDFPGARFQESLCVLSFLWSTNLPNNFLHGKHRVLEWIGLGLNFWCNIQHRDGSFDEAYPLERSLAATAFTAFYISEALGFLGGALHDKEKSRVVSSLRDAGQWLIQHDETHGFLSNHLAAAAAALLHISRITGEQKFQSRSEYFLQKILKHQSSEGWYEEYGGADPGYQTHGTFYLVRYWQMTNDQALRESLERSMKWLAYFVHPDGSLGGEYASRNTQTYYPAAFEIFASQNAFASWIAQTMRPSVMSGAAAGLRTVDLYNYFPLLNNLVFAFLGIESQPGGGVLPVEPGKEMGLTWFPKAGMARMRTVEYDAVVGTSKGGVLKLFNRRRNMLVFSDCGYLGRLSGGKIVSSQYMDIERPVLVDRSHIEVEGEIFEMTRPVMNPLKFLAFRGIMASLGRFPMMGKKIKELLVRVLIYKKTPLPIRFKRKISFGETEVTIQDSLKGTCPKELNSLQWVGSFTTIHMGSSKYFITNELGEHSFQKVTGNEMIDLGSLEQGVEFTRKVKF